MKSSVGVSNFLLRSLVFLILLFSSISLHWSLREAFLSLLAILWNSAFKWVYLSFSPLHLLPFFSQHSVHFSSVQLLSHVWLFATPWTAAHQASLSFTNPWSLLKLMSIELEIHTTISSSIVPFSSCLQYFQHQGLFQWVSSSHQVAKVLEFPLQHQPFQWIFKTDFL